MVIGAVNNAAYLLRGDYLRFGSLFSGIGGFDLGLEREGMQCAWQVEQDPICLRVLNHHWANVPKLNDVRLVNEKSVESVDLICGGFPCQDVSVAGQRKGLDGERSGLWFEFLRIIESLKPRWVVIENVPGLLSSNRGRDFAVILRGLVECGYGVCWRILDAQFDGVAQRRRRVFIVASLGNGSSAQVLFEREGVSWDSPTRREARQSVAGTLKGGTGKRGYPDPSDGNGGGLIASTIRTYEGGSARGDGADKIVCAAIDTRNHRVQSDGISGTLNSKNQGYSLNYQNPIITGYGLTGFSEYAEGAATIPNSGGDCGGGSEVLVAAPKVDATLGANDWKGIGHNRDGNVVAFNWQGGGNQTNLGADTEKTGCLLVGQTPAIAWHENKSGQLTPEIAKALRAGASHSYQGVGVRRLTPIECERLQGFPDQWTAFDAEGKPISDSARYRMLGNAVAVPCAQWIAKRIVEVEALLMQS
jgi:DNA (cytosine-5)-methyltransferase 1